MNSPGQRFTLDGSESLEQHLRATCEQVRAGVRDIVSLRNVEGLLLGGGYGRGEGGVLLTGEGDRPYNDLEFYLFVRNSTWLHERRFGRRLHGLGEILGAKAGLDIEFKITSLRKLRRSPTTMFSYDLVCGHRWLVGQDELLAGCKHHQDAARIPAFEATRLLMNRCSGLLFSAEQLSRPHYDAEIADFVGRNLAKAQLGFGDVLLTLQGQYHWSCLVRHERFRKLPLAESPSWTGAIREHHAAGVEFKLHPVRSNESRERLQARLAELTALAGQLWLWLESKRLGTHFGSVWEYASSRVDKCPETRRLKNQLLNLRTFGPTTLVDGAGRRYPRERLLTTLALMLFAPAKLREPEALHLVQRTLHTDARDLPGLVSAYRELWSRFN